MTTATINAIIKENNQSDYIKWKVVKNTKNHIVLTNDYDSTCKFEINVDEENNIKVSDISMETCDWLLYGPKYYDDFYDMEVGLTMAIKKIVRHFYYYY